MALTEIVQCQANEEVKKLLKEWEKKKSVYFKEFDSGWIDCITVCESSTGRTFRVRVFGSSVEGRLSSPQFKTYWIFKDEVDNNPEHAANLASHKAHPVRLFYYGQCLVSEWRGAVKANKITQDFAKETNELLNAKYGRGWVYINEAAQLEASRILNKKLKGVNDAVEMGS